MQRYLEPGVDIALTLGLIFLLRPIAALLAEPSLTNLFITIPAMLALMLGFVLLRHVESAVPSWADSVEMPVGKWSVPLWIYAVLLSWLCLTMLLAYSGLGDFLITDTGLENIRQSSSMEEYDSVTNAISQLIVLLLVAAVVGAIPLLVCMLYKAKNKAQIDSRKGLLLRGLGLLAFNFAFLVFAAYSSITYFKDFDVRAVFEFSRIAYWPIDFMLQGIAVFQLSLGLVLFTLPLHHFTRAYNLHWLRTATYVLNLVIAAFIVAW